MMLENRILSRKTAQRSIPRSSPTPQFFGTNLRRATALSFLRQK